MRNIFFGIFLGILLSLAASYGNRAVQKYLASGQIISPLGKIFERPLDKYTIDALRVRTFTGSRIVLDEPIATTSAYTKYIFHFISDDKKVTGVATIPPGDNLPVIVQLRGFIDPKTYFPGNGTVRSAEVFARNGFISLAPDFLGYAGSDQPASDVFEERFETYTTALNLLASVPTLPMASDKIGIWGHSNGGQIALTVLEILNRPVPAVLWAPVSKPFPYSILYFTDDIPDHGKALRKVTADFETNYDAEKYSLTNYLERISGPVLLQQGTADQNVPQAWSDALAKQLKNVDYVTYQGADHNMIGAWDAAVARDVAFFRKELR